MKGGNRGDPPRVVKKESLVIKQRSFNGCVQRCSCSVSRKGGARAPRRKESKREEEVVWKRDCKTEIDEETDCKKKLDERKKHLQRQLRDM